MKLSIVIPVKNDASGLSSCLQSIQRAANERVSYEVLVVDNGSSDESVAAARQHGAKVLLAPEVTVSTLRNLGAKEAKGDVLAFIDADCTVAETWFEALEPYLDNHSVICFGSPPTIPEKATWVQSCWYQIRRKNAPTEEAVTTEWLESMNMFVRRDVFWKIGGFDEDMITCEDYDLCMRLQGHGSLLSDSRIVAIHHGEASTTGNFYKKERWRGSSNFKSFRKHGFAMSEMPSVLLPLIHVIIAILAVIGLVFSLSGLYPLWIWVVVVLMWQLPLLLLGLRKSERASRWSQAFGIGVLLNLYFAARGLSLFSGAAWREPEKKCLAEH
jgi:glycosyltransferase involved in cell wall biosynthesis